MGAKLSQYFIDAAKLGGIEARVELAKITGVTSLSAKTAADDPVTIKKFEDAMSFLKSAYKNADVIKIDTRRSTSAETDLTADLKTALDNMKANKSSFIHQLEATAKQVTETSSKALNIARVSIWFINAQHKSIECIDLYEKSTGKHSSGLALYEKDFPAYFKALSANRAINAHNAHTDYRTSCFSESYLKPLGINSMLDIPIWYGNEMKGVICNEHIGPTRTWSINEADFGVNMASFITEALA